MLATIAQRDAMALAGRAGRSRLGVRPCAKDPALWEELVASLMGLGQGQAQGQPRGAGSCGGGPVGGEMVLLEAHGSFFAYEPILKALQGITETSLPFADIICGRGGTVGLPAYMGPDTR